MSWIGFNSFSQGLHSFEKPKGAGFGAARNDGMGTVLGAALGVSRDAVLGTGSAETKAENDQVFLFIQVRLCSKKLNHQMKEVLSTDIP